MTTILVSAFVGSLLTIAVHILLKKRGRFSYFTTHNRIGLSGDDAVFGSVRVTWQGTELPNLYASTITLTNQSLNDYENVKVRVYTNDTRLLNERTELVGTTQIIDWDPEFRDTLQRDDQAQFSDEQLANYRRNRVYLIPTFNRGQRATFTYLNSAEDSNQIPTVWLDINHPGVKLKFSIPQRMILGVPQPAAAFTGLIFGLVVLYCILSYFDIGLLIPMLSFIAGAMLIVPGAYIVKFYEWVRNLLGN